MDLVDKVTRRIDEGSISVGTSFLSGDNSCPFAPSLGLDDSPTTWQVTLTVKITVIRFREETCDLVFRNFCLFFLKFFGTTIYM